MNKSFGSQPTLLLFAAMALGTLATQAGADSGYLTDDRDQRHTVVRSGTDLCWHTSDWTSKRGNEDCDPSPMTMEVPAAPAPTPVAAAPVDRTPVARKDVAPERAAPAVAPVAAPVAAYVAPAVVEKAILAADTLFANDKSVIKPAGKAVLDKLVLRLEGNDRVILPVGYTSSTGTAPYNLALSHRRANAVKAYLVSRGIDADRIHPSGRGENDPVASNATTAGRASNRRVEIEVMATHKDTKW
jgi:OmpA-OmpF porin, OOP family